MEIVLMVLSKRFLFGTNEGKFMRTENFVLAIFAIIFWDFLILYQIYFLAQVKWNVIISNKHGKYELPKELPNDLGLMILEK